MPYYQPTPFAVTINAAARAAVSVLKSMSIDCYLVGGLACKLYGNPRNANDVDLVVLSDYYTQEELKRQLVSRNSSFYTVASKNPTATYRVLWYRAGWGPCKVDLLLPGVMNIPLITSSEIKTADTLPVGPFALVLLMKLQAWSDHRVAAKEYLRVKQHQDVEDLEFLLSHAASAKLNVHLETYLPAEFISMAQHRATRFVEEFPSSAKNWSAIGFTIRKRKSTAMTVRPKHKYNHQANEQLWAIRD